MNKKIFMLLTMSIIVVLVVIVVAPQSFNFLKGGKNKMASKRPQVMLSLETEKIQGKNEVAIHCYIVNNSTVPVNIVETSYGGAAPLDVSVKKDDGKPVEIIVMQHRRYYHKPSPPLISQLQSKEKRLLGSLAVRVAEWPDGNFGLTGRIYPSVYGFSIQRYKDRPITVKFSYNDYSMKELPRINPDIKNHNFSQDMLTTEEIKIDKNDFTETTKRDISIRYECNKGEKTGTEIDKQLVETYLNYIKTTSGALTVETDCEIRFLLIKQPLFPTYTFFNAWGSTAGGHFFLTERIILRYQDKFLFVQCLTENSEGRIKLEAISESQTKQGEHIPLTDHFLNSLNSARKTGHLNQVYIKNFLSLLSILKNNASQVTFVESPEDIPSPALANLVRTNKNSVNAKWIDDKPQPLQKLLINISSDHVSATGSLVTKQELQFWLKNFKFYSDFKQIIFLETDLARTVVYIE